MDQKLGYSDEMYVGSKEERLRHFNNVNVDHYHQSVIYESILDFVFKRKKYNTEEKVGFYHLIGDTGVGKSHMENLIRNDQTLYENESSCECYAVLSIHSPVPLSTKNEYLRYIYKSILFDLKLIPDNQELPKGTIESIGVRVKDALVENKVKLIILDEADNLWKMENYKSSSLLRIALEYLLDQTQIKLVLISSNRMPVTTLRDEIHFYPSYKLNNKRDERNFQEVLTTFQSKLPFRENCNLINYWEYILEKTDGRIGVLKKWLTLCVGDALLNNKNHIDYALLQKNEPNSIREIKDIHI